MGSFDAGRGVNLRILRYLALHPDGRSLYQMGRDLDMPHQVATSHTHRLARHGFTTVEQVPQPGAAGYKWVARLTGEGALAALLAQSSQPRPQPLVSLVPGGC